MYRTEVDFLSKKNRQLKANQSALIKTFEMACQLLDECDKEIARLERKVKVTKAINDISSKDYFKPTSYKRKKEEVKTHDDTQDEYCTVGTCRICDMW